MYAHFKEDFLDARKMLMVDSSFTINISALLQVYSQWILYASHICMIIYAECDIDFYIEGNY